MLLVNFTVLINSGWHGILILYIMTIIETRYYEQMPVLLHRLTAAIIDLTNAVRQMEYIDFCTQDD